MLHKGRIWNVAEIWGQDGRSPEEELAKLLSGHDYVGCQGFRLGGYLFLNDSGDWGIVRQDDPARQVESVTFDWCTQEQAATYIRRACAGEFDYQAWDSGIKPGQIQTSTEHAQRGGCGHCH